MTPSTVGTGHALRSAIALGGHISKIVHCTRDFKCAAASGLQHDPEKWGPVFRQGHAQTKDNPRVCFKFLLKQTLGPKPLKNHLICIANRTFALRRRPHRPSQKRQSENVAGDPGRRRRQLLDPEGHEMRPGVERMAQIQHALALFRRQFLPIVVIIVALGDDAAGQPRHLLTQCQHLVRVERHADDGAGIGAENLCHSCHQFAVAVEMALHFDHERHAALDHCTEIAERHHPLGGILELDRLELACGHAKQRPAAFGETAERAVMMHHRLAICGELQIAFDTEIAIDRGLSRARHVFDDTVRSVMQPAMGHRTRRQPAGRAHPRVFRYETSNTPSTSTAASAGSEATPTVVRAWRPLSPNASTIRSEAPFSTFGPSRKSGAELTKPPSRTTRTTLSRSPSAALICASRLMAQPRAAALPCSTVTPAPSLPLAISLPSGLRQTCPETNSRFPVRTKPT